MAQNLAKWDSDGSDSDEGKSNAAGRHSAEEKPERAVTGTTGQELGATAASVPTPGSSSRLAVSTGNTLPSDRGIRRPIPPPPRTLLVDPGERKNMAAKKESTLPWCIPSSSTEKYRNMPPVTSEPVASSSARVPPGTDDDIGPVYVGRSTLLDAFRERDRYVDDLDFTNVSVTTISQAEARRRVRESREETETLTGPSESDVRRAFYRQEVIKFMEKKNARRERMRNNPDSKF